MTFTVGQRVIYRDWGWVYPNGKDKPKEWGQLMVEVEIVKVTAKRLRIKFDDGLEQVCDPAKSITPIKATSIETHEETEVEVDAWVKQVNDLARKIDGKAAELAKWGVHPSAWDEELKPLTDAYVQTTSGGTYQTIEQLVDAVKEKRCTAIIPVSERRTVCDYWVTSKGYYRCLACGKNNRDADIEVTQGRYMCRFCVAIRGSCGRLLDALIKAYPDGNYRFFVNFYGTLLVYTDVTNDKGRAISFAFNEYSVLQEASALAKMNTELAQHYKRSARYGIRKSTKRHIKWRIKPQPVKSTAIVPVSPAITLRESTFKLAPVQELQKGDRVRVTHGAYMDKVGTVVSITRFKKRLELSYCVISWDDRSPVSAYKLWMVERVSEESKPTTCDKCGSAITRITHYYNGQTLCLDCFVGNPPSKPTRASISCATCGSSTAPEAIASGGKIYCVACSEHLLHEKASEQPVPDIDAAPAPRRIEQPRQDIIPMVQLRMF